MRISGQVNLLLKNVRKDVNESDRDVTVHRTALSLRERKSLCYQKGPVAEGGENVRREKERD